MPRWRWPGISGRCPRPRPAGCSAWTPARWATQPGGAGRARKEDPVSAAAGVLCLAKPGDWVQEGEPVLELRADDESRFDAALPALGDAVQVGPERPALPALVIDRVGE